MPHPFTKVSFLLYHKKKYILDSLGDRVQRALLGARKHEFTLKHEGTLTPLLASFVVEIQLSKRLSSEDHPPAVAREPGSSAGPPSFSQGRSLPGFLRHSRLCLPKGKPPIAPE